MTKMTPYYDFGLYLSDKFKEWFRGKTQTEIAGLLGTQQALISKWYKGERLPSDEMLKRICAITDNDLTEKVAEAKKNKKIVLDNVEVVHKQPYIDEKKIIDSLGKPRIELSAIAGLPTEYIEDFSDMQPTIQQIPRYDFTIRINGDSMMPEYKSGDEVACLRIRKGEFIQWGKVYVLNTSQGAFIKRLYKGEGCYRCVSDNEKYPAFEVKEDEMYSISLVVGLLRIY